MSKVRDENYFMVAGWMINRLGLKGVALQVYSIIYGFTQDGETYFTGSLQYLCDFTNASRPTVIKALKELVEGGFILKFENEMNGVKFNKYKVNPGRLKTFTPSQETLPGVVKKLDYPSQETLPGGSKETLHNNISLDIKEDKKDIYTQVCELYHSICVSFPSVRQLSDARKKNIQNLLKTYTLDDFRTVFQNAEKSSFLKGSSGWKASFDWLLKEANFLKVLEGNYADKGRKEPVPGWAAHSLGDAELDAIRQIMSDTTLDTPTAGTDPAIAERAEKLRRELGG